MPPTSVQKGTTVLTAQLLQRSFLVLLAPLTTEQVQRKRLVVKISLQDPLIRLCQLVHLSLCLSICASCFF